MRAYATNANGTFYGDDLTFTTTCGIVSTFPWNEGFENAGAIPDCWSQEQVNSSGLNLELYHRKRRHGSIDFSWRDL